MPSAALNPARAVFAPGNGGAGQKVTCAWGFMAVLDDGDGSWLTLSTAGVDVAGLWTARVHHDARWLSPSQSGLWEDGLFSGPELVLDS